MAWVVMLATGVPLAIGVEVVTWAWVPAVPVVVPVTTAFRLLVLSAYCAVELPLLISESTEAASAKPTAPPASSSIRRPNSRGVLYRLSYLSVVLLFIFAPILIG